MWDWSGSKNPPPSRGRDAVAEEALEQGITPSFRPVHHGYRRDPRIINYGDPKDRVEASMYGIPPQIPVHNNEKSEAPWTLNELTIRSRKAIMRLFLLSSQAETPAFGNGSYPSLIFPVCRW